MIGPFSVDTYLPAFPNIQATLDATPIQVQQTLTAYMFAFGFMLRVGARFVRIGGVHSVSWRCWIEHVGTKAACRVLTQGGKC